MILRVNNVSHGFGSKRVLHNINLNISDGQFVSIVGPSGCGKSTLLRAIFGTHPPQQGQVVIDAQDVVGPTKTCGMVYQNYSLYDHLTIEENVAFGPKVDQTTMLTRWRLFWWHSKYKEMLETARAILTEYGLEACCKKYPRQCSGGQRQRAAIAQAIVMQHPVMLLDEPFGALDEASRELQQQLLLKLYEQNIQAKQNGHRPPYTVVLVTHEQNEAFYVCDRVIGLSQYWSALDSDGVTTNFGKDLGATIVYDKAAPTFKPGEVNNPAKYADLKNTLRKAVFEEDDYQCPKEHVTFWSDLEDGHGTGISATATNRER